MGLVMVGQLPLAWRRNVGLGRLMSRRGFGALRSRGMAGPASGYATFAAYNAAKCLPLSGANVCPPPYDPSCVGPASAAVSACQNLWVTDPTSCRNVVCDANGNPVVTSQSYTTSTGTAASGVGYNTVSGFVPVPAAVPAPATKFGYPGYTGAVSNTSTVSSPRQSAKAAPSASPPTYSPTLAFTNSRGSTALQPGDTWTVSITGAPPNAAVTVTGALPGSSVSSTTPMGSTDSSGNFSLSGTITAGQSGNWAESWAVGGSTIGSFAFTVTVPAPPAAPAVPTVDYTSCDPVNAPWSACSGGAVLGPTGTPGVCGPCGGPIGPVSPYYLGPSPPPAAQDMTGAVAPAAAASAVPTWVWIAGAALLAFGLVKGK